jgi:hypothetical protein
MTEIALHQGAKERPRPRLKARPAHREKGHRLPTVGARARYSPDKWFETSWVEPRALARPFDWGGFFCTEREEKINEAGRSGKGIRI